MPCPFLFFLFLLCSPSVHFFSHHSVYWTALSVCMITLTKRLLRRTSFPLHSDLFKSLVERTARSVARIEILARQNTARTAHNGTFSSKCWPRPYSGNGGLFTSFGAYKSNKFKALCWQAAVGIHPRRRAQGWKGVEEGVLPPPTPPRYRGEYHRSGRQDDHFSSGVISPPNASQRLSDKQRD